MNDKIKSFQTYSSIEAICNLYKNEKDIGRIAQQIQKESALKEKKHKLVHTIGIFYPKLGQGGVERVISLLAPLYKEMGYNLVIIVEEINEKEDFRIECEHKRAVIPTIAQVEGQGDYKPRGIALQKVIRENKIDILCYHASTYKLLLFDLLVSKMEESAFVIVKHDLFSQGMVQMDDRICWLSKVYALADRLIVLSNAERKFWKILGINAEYIYNPVGKYRESQKIVNKRKIVWVGRLDKNQKQYLDAIAIMKRVTALIPDAFLEIYGAPYSVGSLDELTKSIKEFELEENVKYCGYTLDVDRIYGDANIHLVTSLYESFPMNIYESKCMSLPLVSYDMPYLEFFREGKGQILVEQGDICAAADAVVAIMMDTSLRMRLSEEAKESVSGYTNEKLKEMWKSVFNNSRTITVIDDNLEDEKIILETLLLHYERGCHNYKIDIADKMKKYRKRNLQKTIQMIKNKTKKKFIIYPYGVQGHEVERIIKELYPEEEIIAADNQLALRNHDIKQLYEISKIDFNKYLLLLCSNSSRYYEEIRTQLYSCISAENVIDLYEEL